MKPALVHCEAVSRKAFFRDSTEVKMPEVDEGSGRVGPNLQALVMEKSHASGPPLGPRGTQTSAGRREAFARSGRVRVWGARGSDCASVSCFARSPFTHVLTCARTLQREVGGDT